MAAAVEADRQAGSHDLLATALALKLDAVAARRDGSEVVGDALLPGDVRAVAAMAEQAARGMSAASLVFGRYGSRSWGGIAAAVATSLTVGLLLSESAATRADAGFPADGTGVASVQALGQNEAAESRSDPSAVAADRKASPSPEDEPTRSRITADEQTPSANDDHGARDPSASNGAAGADSRADAGSGEGFGRTHEAAGTPPPGDAIDGGSLPAGRGASAGGGSESTSTGDADETGGSVRGTAASHGAPAWRSAGTAPDTGVSGENPSEAVPDSYRDLVRDYFNRDDATSVSKSADSTK